MQWMDTHNPLTKPDTEYGKRLEKLTGHIKEVDGLKVNFGVYEVIDVNAFACGDGSVRICAGLMDIMTDDVEEKANTWPVMQSDIRGDGYGYFCWRKR